jgi:hypothetical protein
MELELPRALAVLAEPPTPETARIAGLLGLEGPLRASSFTDLFVLQLHPYASLYVGAEGALGGEARDRVAGFWRALHLDPPSEPDHLAALLGLYASLGDREHDAASDRERAAWRHARGALLWEHLWCWLGPYLRKVDQVADGPYAAWGRLLHGALSAAAQETPAPPRVPLHLRLAPPLPAADAESRDWIDALLAPVRSGVILTRWDLARAARDLGVGLRAGGRRFGLEGLFQQDPGGTATWLATEALAAADAHARDAERLGVIAEFWASRARQTADALTLVPAHGAR